MNCPVLDFSFQEGSMNQAEALQKVRKMRFEQIYRKWKDKELRQADAAEILNMSERTFRRYAIRYENSGTEGLLDKRVERTSPRRASVEEVVEVESLYRDLYMGRNVVHFYEAYTQRHEGKRSYNWVKSCLHRAELVKPSRRRGPHRQLRDRKPREGMMIHQDASDHEWVSGEKWDLVVTMDDATGEIYSAFFVGQEGTQSSFRGVREVLEGRGIFSSFYSDRGSHYWITPVAGGRVDKENLTQFGRAMAELGVRMIPGYSPQARGRSERMFRTLQGRLPQELREAGIRGMEEANEYLSQRFLGPFNEKFSVEPGEQGSAFVPLLGVDLDNILCIKNPRVVGNDNCVSYKGMKLQIPPVKDRYHFVRANVMVHEYDDGRMAVYHGKRRVGSYDSVGRLSKGGRVNRDSIQIGGHVGDPSFTSASSGYALRD